MTKYQALVEIKNFLSELSSNKANEFLEHLLNMFDDPEGWLQGIEPDIFRGCIKKHYHKTFKYEDFRKRKKFDEDSLYSR